MKHTINKVISFEHTGPYRLRVLFDDGISRAIDFRPVLSGPIFGALLDLNLFAAVKIDPEVHTIVWPNGADFDPETLHDWPEIADDFSVMAHSWNTEMARCEEKSPLS
jgi:hypothetical protein